MFKRLGHTVAGHPWRVITAWVAIALVVGMIGSAKLYDVTTDNQSSFLPTSYESARATEFGEEAFGRVSGASSVTALPWLTEYGPFLAVGFAAQALGLLIMTLLLHPYSPVSLPTAVFDSSSVARRACGLAMRRGSRPERSATRALNLKASSR